MQVTVMQTAVRKLLGLISLAACVAASGLATSQAESGYQGFGASTRGGDDGKVVTVTSLDNSGPGTLRAALDAGNRRVVFEVGGTISLKNALILQHPHVTVDGETAPSPGISVENKPFVIANTHDVVLRHLRFRESDDDNLRITGGCRNVVVDHCSSTRAGDGAIDITVD
jgi:pectate lyase